MEIILAAALLPAIILMIYVYKQDSVEKEPIGLLLALFGFGMLSCIPASILEEVFTGFLDASAPQDKTTYHVFWHYRNRRRRLQAILLKTQNLARSKLQLYL